MNAKTEKIARIKKSCKIGMIICRILSIICIVGAVASLIGMITMLVVPDTILEGASVATGDAYASVQEDLSLTESDITIDDLTNDAGGIALGPFAEESGLPGMANPFLKEASFSTQILFVTIFAAVLCALGAFIWFLFSQVFSVIQKEESPFADTVMNKLKINFILLTVMLGISIGIGAAAVAAFLFWCIYNIFDYGRLLQVESDETL